MRFHLTKSFKEPIYGNVFTLCVTTDMERSIRHFIPGVTHEDHADWNGGTFYAGPNLYVFLRRDNTSYNIVCHELYHAVNRALEFRSITPGRDNHEPFAYMQGWLAAQFFRQLKTCKITINHTHQ